MEIETISNLVVLTLFSYQSLGTVEDRLSNWQKKNKQHN